MARINAEEFKELIELGNSFLGNFLHYDENAVFTLERDENGNLVKYLKINNFKGKVDSQSLLEFQLDMNEKPIEKEKIVHFPTYGLNLEVIAAKYDLSDKTTKDILFKDANTPNEMLSLFDSIEVWQITAIYDPTLPEAVGKYHCNPTLYNALLEGMRQAKEDFEKKKNKEDSF
jgi:hypothetical protein